MKLSRFLLPLFLGAAVVMVGADAPPPAHVDLMKQVAALNGKITKGEDLKASAASMADVMTKVAAYWTPKDPAAGKLATDAATAAKALAAGTGDEAMNKATIGASCRGCHPAHREGAQGGPYSIK
jgi:hypothetical protein